MYPSTKPVLRLLMLMLWLSAALSCSRAPERSTASFLPEHPHLLLMHPTTANIHTINHLIEQGIFPLPGNYRIIGVYHDASAYDFDLSAAYLGEHSLDRFALYGIDEQLEPGQIFSRNGLSETFRWLFEQSEGVFFMGGPDIPPALYGEPTSLLTVITDPHRHYLELSFLFHLIGGYQDVLHAPLLDEDPSYRILGICLGMQSMNVAAGGTMVQDIPTGIYGLSTVEEVVGADPDVQHRNYYANLRQDPDVVRYSFHQIIIDHESISGRIAMHPDARPFVLSSHHQALGKTGKGFRVTAWSVDSLIAETIEHKKYPNVIGVQYHPEVITLYDTEARLTFKPGSPATDAYPDLYPGDRGELFHRSFWKHIAMQYPQ